MARGRLWRGCRPAGLAIAILGLLSYALGLWTATSVVPVCIHAAERQASDTEGDVCSRVRGPRCAKQANGAQGFVVPTPLPLELLSRESGALGARSTISWAVLEWPSYAWPSPRDSTFVFDDDARSVDLTMVAIRDHCIHVYGVSDDQRRRLRLPERWPAYPAAGHDSVISCVEFRDQLLPIAQCDEWVEETTLFLAGVHEYNMYHLHNDNILPMFTHLRSLGLLGDEQRRRLYIFPRTGVGWGHHRIAAYSLLDELFQGNVHDASSLRRKQTCFRHIRWGRNVKPSLVKDQLVDARHCTDFTPTLAVLDAPDRVHPNDPVRAPLLLRQTGMAAGDMVAWQHWVLCRKTGAVRVRPNRLPSGDSAFVDGPVKWTAAQLHACRRYRDTPSVLWFDRDGRRSISNAQTLVDKIVARGLRVDRCCDFTSPSFSLADVLRRVQRSDIVWSIHGAAMGHVAYLPPGGVVVEMQPEGFNWAAYIPFFARGLEHTVLEMDIRSAQGNGPYTLPDTLMNDMIDEVLRHWNRSQPCTQEESDAKQRYYSPSRPYVERFPLSDLRGDRHRHIDKAVASL